MQPAMSTLHYSAMTSVIVRVADSVTESSSGTFIMETPQQTSGTGPLPAGQRPEDKQLFVLGRVPHSSSHHSGLTSVTGQLCSRRTVPRMYAHCIFCSDEAGQAFLLSVFDQLVFFTQFHVVKR